MKNENIQWKYNILKKCPGPGWEIFNILKESRENASNSIEKNPQLEKYHSTRRALLVLLHCSPEFFGNFEMLPVMFPNCLASYFLCSAWPYTI